MGEHRILLVEDDLDAASLMLRALEKADPDCKVQILGDGAQAIADLTERLGGSSPLPHIIITDLKMPKKSGFEVISWIRAQPGLAELPVVVLSASSEQKDIDLAMRLGANAYFEKPISISELVEIARSILIGKTDYQPKK